MGEDFHDNYSQRLEPFFSINGDELIPFGNVQFQTSRIEELEATLRTIDQDGYCAVVCSCRDEEMTEASNIIRRLNMSRTLQHSVRAAWATSRDSYSAPRDRVRFPTDESTASSSSSSSAAILTTEAKSFALQGHPRWCRCMIRSR